MTNYKIKRIESDIVRYISEIILNDVRYDLIKSITITGCSLTSDLSYCRVYFTSMVNVDKRLLEKEVNDGSAFIRNRLAKVLDIRHTPELGFVYDDSIAYGEKIEKIIDSLDNNE